MFATVSAAALVSGLLGVPTAFSGDAKIIPGIACVRVSAGTPAPDPQTGGLFNTSGTQGMNILCPIVRDNTTAAWRNIRVNVLDNSSSSNVSCRGGSADRDASPTFLSAVKSTSGTGSQSLNILGISESDGGHFFLSCFIPPLSGIFSYDVDEP